MSRLVRGGQEGLGIKAHALELDITPKLSSSYRASGHRTAVPFQWNLCSQIEPNSAPVGVAHRSGSAHPRTRTVSPDCSLLPRAYPLNYASAAGSSVVEVRGNSSWSQNSPDVHQTPVKPDGILPANQPFGLSS